MQLAARLLEGSPLRHAAFRMFYAGSVGVALGYTMQATVAAWLMATLTPSALMVALVQTASTLPTLLFGLAAGALADIVDRRRVILATQILMLSAGALVGVVTLAGLIGPVSLLLLTFLIGAGFTFYMPAQQASVNDLVDRTEMSSAVALNAVAFNVARAIGPALAGAVAAWIGTGSALLGSALFFIVMIVAVRQWRGPARVIPGVPETLVSGMLSGLRYTRHSAPLRALIFRSIAFSICASAFWALLPVIARDQLGLGAGGFGLLSAAFGVGAVVGALSIPGQLKRSSLNRVVTTGTVLSVVAMLLVAVTGITVLALVGAFCAGAAWVTVLASLSAGTQSAAPGWVRARALAMSLVGVQASLATGSVIWGLLATLSGTQVAMAAAAGTMAALLALSRGVRVRLGEEADVTPGMQAPELTIAAEPRPDDGPVLIQLEYRIAPEHRSEFLRRIRALEPIRRRNGASSWRVFRDLAEDGRFVERFIIESWAEYVRLRTRMTVTDRTIESRVTALQRADVPIRVSRLLGVSEDEEVVPATADMKI
jgi:MFS family permease